MFEEFAHARFAKATFAELQTLLGALRSTIRSQFPDLRDSEMPERLAIEHFHQTVERVCQQLRHAGHDIFRLDYDGDARYDQNSQLWGTDYQNGHPHGLEIEFRP